MRASPTAPDKTRSAFLSLSEDALRTSIRAAVSAGDSIVGSRERDSGAVERGGHARTNGDVTATATRLKHRGLQPFLWTQFLGAFNDNLFKIVVSMLAVHWWPRRAPAASCRSSSAVFILPFLLFSGYAGQLADVYSKRTVLVVSKSLEIVAATLGLVAFLFGHLQLTYAVLFLIALQATFFSPAKYGILPEMLPDRDLSRANGVLEMSTFVAIVLGTAVGGYLFEAWQRASVADRRPRRRRRRRRDGVELSHSARARGRARHGGSTGIRGARSGTGLEHAASRSRALADGRRHLVFLVPRLAAAAGRDPVRHAK